MNDQNPKAVVGGSQINKELEHLSQRAGRVLTLSKELEEALAPVMRPEGAVPNSESDQTSLVSHAESIRSSRMTLETAIATFEHILSTLEV